MEEWRDVSGFEGLYEVSSLGNIRSLDYNHTGVTKILKPFPTADGYLRVCLYKGDNRTTKTIHTLVARAFIPNPEGKPEIDHINQNKQDNRVENLRWATRSEQQLNRPHAVGLSGHRHIYKYRNRWRVRIKRNCVIVYYESFETLPEAIAARDYFLASL